MALPRAQHVQRPRVWGDVQETGNQPFGARHRGGLGLERGLQPRRGVGPLHPLLGPQPARRRGRLGGASLAPPARWSRSRPGRLMGGPARPGFRGVVPGRANVRSPRPPAAGAPAPTPGADRYASGGGRPERPLPGRLGPSFRASRAAGGAPRRGTAARACRLLSASLQARP